MNKEFTHLVFIGRFQPPHNGHFKVIETALEKADKVLVLLGSSNSNRTLRNPFTFNERVDMLKTYQPICDAWFNNRLEFYPIDDHTYADEEWIKQVQNTVQRAVNPKILQDSWEEPTPKIGLIGCAKDNSSYYLKLFPQWGNINVPLDPDRAHWDSTHIRRELFDVYASGLIKQLAMPAPVVDKLRNLVAPGGIGVEWFLKLKDEYNWVQNYKKMWADTPYPVIFNTVDTVVVQSGHVLLVKRAAYPGKGLWAMPGGYINPDESLTQSALRELREETKIGVDDWTLKECIKRSETFADPHRSARGRVITHAFLIRLPDRKTLPKVKGSDDAEKAKWVPLAELRADNMFEDHFHIVKKMIAGL